MDTRSIILFLLIIGIQQLPINAQILEDSVEIFEFVEEFPLFPGCAELDVSYDEKKRCSDNEMRKFLMQKMVYSKEAREMGLEEKVFVRFVINTHGKIEQIELNQGAAAPLKEMVRTAVESMNELPPWTPGYQRGKAVAVRLMMPIRIRLN